MKKAGIIAFIKRFISIDPLETDFSMVIRPDHILSLAYTEQGKRNDLFWHFKNGLLKKARLVKVLNNTYILVEERKFLSSKAILININELASVSFGNS